MITTTTPQIEGKQIKEYKGIVFGEVVSGIDFINDLKA
ncbi:MAG: heavy metal-binding domain-containing protein, partial [Prevotellaceae bacterium]|nr:heavy metal-binding domain-containing protein [Prevotellaceae bacterium]